MEVKMENLTLTDIKVVWDQMEQSDWEDFRTVLENEKHKPEGIEHDLADQLIDKTYEFETLAFPDTPEDLYAFLKEN